MPKTLLLADDSVTIQKVVGISFANEDVTLVTVDNGDDAISKARETRPDIVLADVVMPGKNGYEVCEAIKADPDLAATPVLLLTGTFETFDEARAEQAGANGHITKPFEAQSLVDQVNELLAAATAPAGGPAPSAEPDPLGLTGTVSPGEAAEQAYDLFEDEVTAPSGVAATETPPTTVLIGGEPLVSDEQNAAAQTWSDAFDDPTPQAPTPPLDLDAEEPVLASGEPLEPSATAGGEPAEVAAPLFGEDSPASVRTQAFVLGDEDDVLSFGRAEPAAPDPIADLFGDGGTNPATGGIGASDTDDATGGIGGDTDNATRVIGDFAPAAAEASSAANAGLATTPDAAESLADEAPLVAPGLLDGDDDPVLGEFAPEATTTLDPGAARAYDVSASELTIEAPEEKTPLTPPIAAEEVQPPQPVTLPSEPNWPAEPEAPMVLDAPLDDLAPVAGATPEADRLELDTQLDPEPAEALPSLAAEPAEEEPLVLDTPEPEAAEPTTTPPAALSPMLEQQLHEGLEKVAWDAFGDLAEQIVKDAVERIERVAWEVIPKMAETLVREEIRKLKEGEE